jgi:hypothetical protein
MPKESSRGFAAPVFTFLAAVVWDGKTTADEHFAKVFSIGKNLCQNAKELVARSVPNLNRISLLQFFVLPVSGLDGEAFFSFAMTVYFRRVNTHKSDGYAIAKDIRQAGQCDCTSIAIVAVVENDAAKESSLNRRAINRSSVSCIRRRRC